jgi:DNA polymerase
MGNAWLKRRLELEKMMGVDALFRRRGVEDELAEIEEQVRRCTKCRLHETRTRGVFARGRVDADLMFIGEGPGADEDAQGLPFVGRAGKLLDEMVAAMGLERDEVYITNIIKSRAPDNREPRSDEIEACWPYLERQIELVAPKMICTLGRPASNALLKTNKSMGEMRGRWFDYRGIPVLPTYHPAYLLRSPGQKRTAWQDLKKLILALHGEGLPPARKQGLF